MAVRVADTIKPMGSGTFPVAEADNLTIETDKTLHTKETIQSLYDRHALGGLGAPSAANKMLVSKEVSSELVWQEVDADNDELGNSAGYQTSSDVSSAIGTALSTTLGSNYASGQFEANSITLTSTSPSSTVSILPSGISINGSAVATQADIQGVTWTVSVVNALPAQGVERVLYLLADSSGSSPDLYEEYIWVVVDSTTNPATYGYEKIGDTHISLAASDITYTNVAQTGVTNVAGSLDQLISDFATLNNAIALSIRSYTVSPSTLEYEKGTQIAPNSLTFAWTFNKPLTELMFNGASLPVSTTSMQNEFQVDTTTGFTLAGAAGSQQVQRTITIKFLDSVYYGSSATGTYNSAFVRALSNSILKENYRGNYPITVATNEYGFIAFPSSFNAPTICKIGGFDTEMELAGTFNVTNASGSTAEYKLYKTINSSLGSLTLVYE